MMLLGAGCAGVVSGGGPSYLLYDTFPGTNGTNLTAHTMDVGSGWTTHTGTFVLDTGKAKQTDGAGQCYTTADAGTGDASISLAITWNTGANEYIGAALRAVNDQDNWTPRIDNGSTLNLYQVTGGAYTSRGTASYTITNGVTYTLSFLVRSDYIVWLMNGTPVLTWISSVNQSNTRYGLYGANGNNSRFDDFKVIAAPAQTTYASDDGDDANGTNLSGKSTDTGQTWTVHSGTWETDSGNIRQTTTTGGYHRTTFDSGQSNVVIEIPFTAGASNHHLYGALLRWTDSTHHWMVRYETSGTDEIEIWEFQPSPSSRATAAVTLTLGASYTLKIVAMGTSISAAILSGSTILASCAYHAASTESTATKVGLLDYRDGTYLGQPLFQSISVKSP